MIDLDKLAAAVADEPAPRPTPGQRLSELVRPADDDPSELLRHRFLCRLGGLLLVGPTGIGKSSFAMQAMILWALGHVDTRARVAAAAAGCPCPHHRFAGLDREPLQL